MSQCLGTRAGITMGDPTGKQKEGCLVQIEAGPVDLYLEPSIDARYGLYLFKNVCRLLCTGT